ncbi:DUF2520 domain-containing protein [Acidimicrobiia bacterium EGI L10123]|uniref:DUF2520 domain-containing protein n=1 Tax=Salinilacustrithrix flava TaxID=2957203 RepID=UPI003D7C29E5|nr:DUF2520 domain-containing protein [Acidimicrobiia bacterium EGI L10123]
MSAFDARIIGPGRAGGALATALTSAGWRVDGPLGRDHDPATATSGARIVLLAVPDGDVADLAASLAPGDAVVAHVAGSLGLDVLAPHLRVASVHPLVSLPDADIGARRLAGAWFAVAGDPVATEAVEALGGRAVEIADEDRTAYHAAAAVAANHLVALLGQVERLARQVGVPLEAYLDLARGALDNVAEVGPAAALTGPVARGDRATVARHLAAIPEDERTIYAVLAEAAQRLVDDGAGVPA